MPTCAILQDRSDSRGNDPELAIPWGVDTPVLSDRDRRHPTIATPSTCADLADPQNVILATVPSRS